MEVCMQARKMFSWSGLVLFMSVAVAVVLFGMVVEVHAQDGDPVTPVPEIVGGAPSTPGEWPWQVALIDGGAAGSNFYAAQFCGGSLIHPQWVLTAAHCITNSSGNVVATSTVDIVAGIYNLSSPAAGFQRRDVIQIVRHPSYNGSTFDNDVALLKLSTAVTIGGSGEAATALVPLVPVNIGDLAGRNSWVTGWGNTQSVPEWPNELHEVQLPIMANSICNDAAHYGGLVTGNMLCAGFDTGGSDACFGDSGGPLVVSDGGQWKLAGVVSAGDGCGEPFSPGIFARVSQYGHWVNANIGQTALVSPSGSIGSNYNPTYTWNAVMTMTHYYLWVDGPNGNVIKQWYTAEQVGCADGTGTCSVTPSTSLGGGDHNWWIQTWNPAGYGPWSTGMSFSLPILLAPGATTLNSPSGAITDNTPTYTWDEVTGATWYYLWVDGPTGNKVKQWYTAAQANCNGSTCSATPNVELSGGTHNWWIQTYNSAGYGSWSSGMSFSLAVPTAPAAATLTSPNGSIIADTPTYTWNAVSNAAWYYLWVDGPGGNKIKQWYEASLICGGGTCSVTPGTTLGGGTHTWWVQTYNSVGYGPWSTGMSFSLPVPTPVQPTLISPVTSTTDLTPTYIWNAVKSDTGVPASWYYLWVNGPNGNVIKQWYAADQVNCTAGTGTCSVTPITLVPSGMYTWWVQPYNAAGYGPWSGGLSFTHTSTGGFNSQFSNDYDWNSAGGHWFIENNSWYSNMTNLWDVGYSKSAYNHSASFANLDYSARFYRSGCVWCDNFVYVRGNPVPNAFGFWSDGYQFVYANDGYFAVWKVVGGTWELLQDYTFTSAIAQNGWNTLRVVASNQNLNFYINGVLVWQGTDASLASGYVGVGMDNFEDFVTFGDQVWVDWTILNSYAESAPVITDTVSAEQQALNDAVNTSGSDKADGGNYRQ